MWDIWVCKSDDYDDCELVCYDWEIRTAGFVRKAAFIFMSSKGSLSTENIGRYLLGYTVPHVRTLLMFLLIRKMLAMKEQKGYFVHETNSHIVHGYTVHQQCWTLLLPTDAHYVKKHRVIKTF